MVLLSYPYMITGKTIALTAAAVKSLQLCPTLCDPRDGSPPGSLIPGILQARTLEWVAISFSNAWKWKVKVKSISCVQLLATPWTAAYQAPPSMGFPGKSTDTRWTFVGKVMSLLFNMLSGLVITFSSKEWASFNFMASVTICSDFGAQKNKVWHYFHCFPIYFPWSDGTRCHDLHFLNVEL